MTRDDLLRSAKLVHMIFDYLSTIDIVQASHVSQRWRAIARSNNNYCWTLELRQEQALTTCCRRGVFLAQWPARIASAPLAGPLDLDVNASTLFCKPIVEDPLSALDTVKPEGVDAISAWVEFSCTLRSQMQRLRRLSLARPRGPWIQHTMGLLESTPAPNLVTLALCEGGNDFLETTSWVRRDMFAGYAPKLRTVTFLGVPMPRPGILRSVSQLDLEDCRFDVADLYNSNMNALRKLSLIRCTLYLSQATEGATQIETFNLVHPTITTPDGQHTEKVTQQALLIAMQLNVIQNVAFEMRLPLTNTLTTTLVAGVSRRNLEMSITDLYSHYEVDIKQATAVPEPQWMRRLYFQRTAGFYKSLWPLIADCLTKLRMPRSHLKEMLAGIPESGLPVLQRLELDCDRNIDTNGVRLWADPPTGGPLARQLTELTLGSQRVVSVSTSFGQTAKVRTVPSQQIAIFASSVLGLSVLREGHAAAHRRSLRLVNVSLTAGSSEKNLSKIFGDIIRYSA